MVHEPHPSVFFNHVPLEGLLEPGRPRPSPQGVGVIDHPPVTASGSVSQSYARPPRVLLAHPAAIWRQRGVHSNAELGVTRLPGEIHTKRTPRGPVRIITELQGYV